MNLNFLGITVTTYKRTVLIHIGGGAWFWFYYCSPDKETTVALRTPFFKAHIKNGMAYFSERYCYEKPVVRIGNWRLFFSKIK